GEDLRERRLAEAGRPREEQVIERLAATARRLDEDAEVLLVLRLPDVVVERPRPERALERDVLALLGRVDLARGDLRLRGSSLASPLRHDDELWASRGRE